AYLADNNALLNRAGFRAVKAETPEQRQLFATADPYKFLRGIARGGTFYVYKDESSHIAYVGLEGEYQRYQDLARQEGIAHGAYLAREMEGDAAYRWSGAW